MEKAVELTGIKHIAIAGGVSANSEIRATLKATEEKFGWKTYIPKFEYTTNNAGMIAIVGYLKFLGYDFSNDSTSTTARLNVQER